MAAPVVQLDAVVKDYHGLRPLRVARFTLQEAQSVALVGFDQAMAEVLVNLITGAMLPDAGDVTVFGQPTRDITDADTWLRTLDQFGLVSERAVFLDQMTAEQNLAVAYSLLLDDIPADVRARVHPLADEVGIDAGALRQPIGALSPALRLRVRLGRALALEPRVLLAEHPNAMVPPPDVAPLAADLARIIARRRLAAIVITADTTFARAVADEVLTLHPATGELRRNSGWGRWWS